MTGRDDIAIRRQKNRSSKTGRDVVTVEDQGSIVGDVEENSSVIEDVEDDGDVRESVDGG